VKEHSPLKEYPPLTFGSTSCIGPMFIQMSAHQFHWMMLDTREYCVGLSTLKHSVVVVFPFILLTID